MCCGSASANSSRANMIRSMVFVRFAASRSLPLSVKWLHTSSAFSAHTVTVSEDNKKLKLLCENEPERQFHGIWLRHNCRCPECTSTYNQTIVDPRLLVPSLRVESANVEGDHLNVKWSIHGNTVHNGSFSLDWLKENDYSNPKANCNNKPLVADSLPVSNYEDVMRTDEGLYHWMLQLNHYGVSLLKNVPTSRHDAIKLIEECFGEFALQSSVYGKTYSVVTSDEPTNKAYTTAELLLHMDQGYYENNVGAQLLHCLKYDECVEGGVSTVLDAYPVVEELRMRHPKQFDTLTKVPVRFKNNTLIGDEFVDYFYERKTISLNRDGEIVGIDWHPQFFGPLHPKDDDELEEFYDALSLLAEMFNNSQLKLCHRLQPGEALTFNNRRVVHTRSAFKLNGGERELLGVYLSLDVFRNKFFTLRKLLGKSDSPKCLFNNSSIM